MQEQQGLHLPSTPPDHEPRQASLPSFSDLTIASAEHGDGGVRKPADGELYDDEDEDEDEEDDYGDQNGSFHSAILPAFKLPSAAPQLDFLSLPSPVFGSSFVDLLSIPTSSSTSTPPLASGSHDRPPSRLRTSSRASFHDRRAPEREPTLNFSKPRSDADTRVRRPGKEEDCFVTAFPLEPLEVSAKDPSTWSDRDWNKLKGFMDDRGYQLDPVAAKSGRGVPVQRASDSFPLCLHLVPINDDSWELDVVEFISSAGIRTKAKAHGVLASVPVVALVAVSEDWTAVLVERCAIPTRFNDNEFGSFAKDISGALAFLHLNHISYLGLSPTTIAISPSTPPRYTLSSFVSSIQADPLAKRTALVSGWTGQGYRAPEVKDESSRFDPQKLDAFQLGKLLEDAARSNSISSPDLTALVTELTVVEPKARLTVTSAAQRLKSIFPS